MEPHLVNGTLPPGELKNTLTQIHTKVVTDSTAALGDNRVLQARPLAIHSSEKIPPCLSWAVLSQLCSGHCSRLNDFRFRIGFSIVPGLTRYGRLCESSLQLSISPWEKPWDIANFLAGIPAFSDLPDPGPARQRPT